ncbi:TraR/DksA C4-type zinc finger protein [Alkalihalobacillus sp. R86527]|uniref:TraR/DksA C4-type zinc finger protein n=1 Tax=Alkalihalobacillus sp. R86527 TaxID=3093863 RepID=UPI00366C44D5
MTLSNQEIQGFKKTLLMQKKEILENGSAEHKENNGLAEETGDLTSYDNHFADLATELDEREKDITIEDAARERLELINTALDRIREGNYGICVDTGEQIDRERLEAIPYAIRTKEAQDRLEDRKEGNKSETEASFATGGEREDARIRTVDDLQEEHGNSTRIPSSEDERSDD